MTLLPSSDFAPNRAIAPAAVLGGALCLSVSAILVKLAGVDSATTAMLRCLIAVLALVPLALRERQRGGPLSRSGIGWALIAGSALGIDYAAWTAAINQVGAGISTVLINVQVLVMPLLALCVDREPVAQRFLWTLPLMLTGMCLVGGLGDSTVPGEQARSGTLLGLLAGIGYGIYLFLTRRSTRAEPGRVYQPLTWATCAATMTTMAVAPLTGGLHVSHISGRSWALLIVLALLGQVVSWLLIHHGSVRLAPSTTAVLLLVQPVLALVLSAAVLSEHPTPLQQLGATIVIAAVAISNGSFKILRRIRERQPRQ